ncbi:MAG: TRAP transporter small permease [Spirochaetales bacterium]
MKRNQWEIVYQAVNRALNAFGVGLFIVIFCVVLLQVFMRYVLGSPLVWSEELARYVFIWVSYLGWVFACRSNTHIRISALFDLLSPPVKGIIEKINYALILGFALVLGWLGFRMVLKNLDVPTITLFFTYAFVYLAVPLTCLLIVFETLGKLFLKGKQS